ncbi:hypothetical protein PHPALM_31952 [Phytophthora palmivora]|uniref:Uncharacterized protein n=1 Tax=Phytophthora palmivora TaxID=4796 RepID=A0A2P4X1C2_9STRA|nr:hypothetical protein PHPALM_31952 [Phytophthora palmivora]
MLELRLVHPEPLTDWRFQASFTDTSMSPSKTVILDDLTADHENCLLFDNAQSAEGPTSSRNFNPFLYFPGLHRPSDLYGHVLRIIVTSIKPVTRIVINTSVQFTRFPDEPVVKPPVQSIRQHSEAVAIQEAANFLRASARRSYSASSASRRRLSKPRKKKTVKPPPPNNHEVSTTSLAMDQCSPWISSDLDDMEDNTQSSVLEQVNTLQLEEPPPAVSPRVGPSAEYLTQSPQQPMATVDKKKMELHRLRTNMRVSHALMQFTCIH